MNEHKIIKVLLISQDKGSLSDLKSGLEKNQVRTVWAESGSRAITKVAQENFELVVTDENLGDMTGLELIGKIISQNPMVNCAAVTSLSPADFHEASEGLGILLQLPVKPGQKQAEKLLNQLKTVLNLVTADRI